MTVLFVVFALTILLCAQVLVAFVSAAFGSTRYWALPALVFAVLTIVAFAKGAALPPVEHHGEPAVIDFGPWPYYILGIAALVSAIVALLAGGLARKAFLDRQRTSPPELPVAIVHDR